MKKVSINSLLFVHEDGSTFQKEWAIWDRLRGNSFFLLAALFAGNIGPGLFMISCFFSFDFGLLTGFLIVLFVYGLTHLVFLGRIDRFWRAVFKPQNSWISRGFIFATLFLVFGFLSVAHNFSILNFGFLQKDSPLYTTFLFSGFISAFLLALYPGFLFSCVNAIQFWNSIILVPLFIIQSFGSGIALGLLLEHLPFVGERGMETLLPLEAILITCSALLIGVYLYTRYRAGEAGKIAVHQLLRGKMRGAFVFGALSCEIVIPLAMVMLTFFGVTKNILIAAEFIQLAGILLFKFCLLNAGAYQQLYDEKMFEAKPGK